MDHIEAVQQQAGERYLLGELSAAESDQFEAHYFSCSECAVDLETGSLLIENARAVFKEEQPGSAYALSPNGKPGFWSRWTAAFWPKPMVAATSFASCALAGICLYQAFVLIPQVKRETESGNVAVALPSFQLAGHARGETAILTVPRNAPFFAVSFDIEPQAVFPAYRCELKDSAGAVRFTIPAPAPAAGQPVSVLLPARGLSSGNFRLLLSGIGATGTDVVNISNYVFNLEFK
jgi:hypothetical protein